MVEKSRLSANIAVPPDVWALMDELTEKTGHAVLLIPVEVIARFYQACALAGVEPIDLIGQVMQGMAAAIENGVPSVRFDLFDDPKGESDARPH